MEAVSRIEMVRGAFTIQFYTQFGGLVNYVIKDAPADKPFGFTNLQTIGSFGMFNSFNSVGGIYKKINYYDFLQYRNMNGYRPKAEKRDSHVYNSDQIADFAHLSPKDFGAAGHTF